MQKTIISNEKNVINILSKIKSDGLENLHILADFDNTLTKAFSAGKKRPSLISVLRSEGYLGEDYSKKAYELFDYYNPMETNLDISIEERKKQMSIWRSKHFELLIKSKLHKSDIKKIISNKLIKLRPGVEIFLKFLSKNNVPLVIISANGLGTDSIKIYLKNQGLLTNNIKIISNEFIWDENGTAIGYDKRVVHSLNKDETTLKNYPEIYSLIKNRKNVILLGDSLGDTNMINGFDYQNLIKIGFLNDKENELTQEYKKLYDVVLTGDNNGEFLETLFI